MPLQKHENHRDNNAPFYVQNQELITRSISGQIETTQNRRYRFVADNIMLLPGTYGIQLLSENDEPLAIMSYHLKDSVFGFYALIVHTPQGALIGSLSRKTRRKFIKDSTFRTDMIVDSLKIFYRYGLSGASILSAANHPKVLTGEITYERGLDIIDKIALSSGFVYGSDRNYWYWFSS